MRNQNPPIRWYESDTNVLTMDGPISPERELKKLYQEALEYDFLKGKTPQVLIDNMEEEE